MDEGYLYTLVENDTDTEITIEYGRDKYTLRSGKRSPVIMRLHSSARRETNLPQVRFKNGAGKQLRPIFNDDNLQKNVQITIVRHKANTYSCRKTRRTARNNCKLIFEGSVKSTSGSSWHWKEVKDHLRSMEDLQRKVKIWRTQCNYLFKKFQEGVELVERENLEFQTRIDVNLEAWYKDWHDRENPRENQSPFDLIRPRLNNLSDKCILSTLLRSIYEGEALLRSCGEPSYNRAAFALSSVQPSVDTVSKFALATRELDWIVDFLRCDHKEKSRVASWKWCEKKCRPVPSNCTNRLDAMGDDNLEDDVRRQEADREALHQKLSRFHGNSSFNLFKRRTNRSHQEELEAIWRKRLQGSSCAPGSYSPQDAFVIENPETSFVNCSLVGGDGAFKSVQKCEWLGETVAVSKMRDVPKKFAKAETGFLARVQHPNVVEWMGYAFKKNFPDHNCYRHCYLVTEHMESDLHDLIIEKLEKRNRTISTDPPDQGPFDFLVAVDITLQIVEAVIHVHKCRVLHRDLKPKNVLASPKYPQPPDSNSPMYYTIKLIDFGASKMGDKGSHFHTRKQGTTMYMAPEVWKSEDSYTWSADVYSFGLTCYQIFHGKLPWGSSINPTFANIQKVMCAGDIRFASAYPGELKELMKKCWAQTPSDRPSFEVIRTALWRLKFHPLRPK